MDDPFRKIALLQMAGESDETIAEIMNCELDELINAMRHPEYKKVYHDLVIERHEMTRGMDKRVAKLASDSLDVMQTYLNSATDPDYALKVAGLMLREDRERSNRNKPIEATDGLRGLVIQLNPQFVNAIQEKREVRVVERKPTKYVDASQPGNVQALFGRRTKEDDEEDYLANAVAAEI